MLFKIRDDVPAVRRIERMLAQGLWQTDGKTPGAAIQAAIIRGIAAKGEAARFR